MNSISPRQNAEKAALPDRTEELLNRNLDNALESFQDANMFANKIIQYHQEETVDRLLNLHEREMSERNLNSRESKQINSQFKFEVHTCTRP